MTQARALATLFVVATFFLHLAGHAIGIEIYAEVWCPQLTSIILSTQE